MLRAWVWDSSRWHHLVNSAQPPLLPRHPSRHPAKGPGAWELFWKPALEPMQEHSDKFMMVDSILKVMVEQKKDPVGRSMISSFIIVSLQQLEPNESCDDPATRLAEFMNAKRNGSNQSESFLTIMMRPEIVYVNGCLARCA